MPPGQYVAYLDPTDWPLYSFLAADTGSGQVFTILRDVTRAEISPNSQRVLYLSGLTLHLAEVRGEGQARSLASYELPDGVTECDIAWSPDSTEALVNCGDGVELSKALVLEGNALRDLEWREECSGFSWSPDGIRFAASCGEPDEARTHVAVFDSPDAPGRIIPGCTPDLHCTRPRWSPHGNEVVFFRGSGRSGERQPTDGNYSFDPDCKGSASQCTRPLRGPAYLAKYVAWSPAAPLIAFLDDNLLKLQDAHTGEVLLAYPTLNYAETIVWCPHGDSLVLKIGRRLYLLDTTLGRLSVLLEGNDPIPQACVIRSE
ncbi:MAG: hypothetical protein MUO23_14895 [Anaerolineales bacterium]|nr:hypothetical protein [Anaerolineales bacterium]